MNATYQNVNFETHKTFPDALLSVANKLVTGFAAAAEKVGRANKETDWPKHITNMKLETLATNNPGRANLNRDTETAPIFAPKPIQESTTAAIPQTVVNTPSVIRPRRP